MSVWASAMLILECTDNGNIQDNEAHLNAVQNKTEHRVFKLSLDPIKIYFEDILAVEHKWKLCRGTQVSWFFFLSFLSLDMVVWSRYWDSEILYAFFHFE